MLHQRICCAVLVLAAVVTFPTPVAAQVVFNVSFDATASGLTTLERDAVTSHIREAGRRWVNVIGVAAPRSIEVRIFVAGIPTASGGSATSGFVGVVGGRDLFEQGVAHELRTGIDLNGAADDANITFGLGYLRNELWFDPDPVARVAPVPIDRTDAMSVALHELGHVLVYNGWADLVTGQPPATYWSTFDRWMIPGAPTVFAGAAATQSWGSAPEVTTGNNKHWGNAAFALQLPPVVPAVLPGVQWLDRAPVPFPACSLAMSIDAPPSVDRRVGPQSGETLIAQLMNGVVFYRATRYDISPLDRATLIDTGLLPDRIFASGFDQS